MPKYLHIVVGAPSGAQIPCTPEKSTYKHQTGQYDYIYTYI